MRVTVDSNLCDARGQCSLVDAELFTLDEDGYSNVGRNKPVPDGKEDAAEQGVDICPVQALRVD